MAKIPCVSLSAFSRLSVHLERWQVIRVLDVVEVGEQSQFRMPRIRGQVPGQGHVHVRIEVRVGEDFAYQALQLKLQKPVR